MEYKDVYVCVKEDVARLLCLYVYVFFFFFLYV